MKIRKTEALLMLVFCLKLTACQPIPTPTSAPKIREATAVEIAKSACKTPHLVLTGEPKNIRSQLLTLGEADRLTRAEGETNFYSQALDTPVWLVQMDGEMQLVGGPPPVPPVNPTTPTPTPPQPFPGTCKVILDAKSGSVIVIRG